MWRVLPNAPNRAPSKTIKALFIWLDRHNAVTRFMGYFHGQLGRERERTEASYGTQCVCLCVCVALWYEVIRLTQGWFMLLSILSWAAPLAIMRFWSAQQRNKHARSNAADTRWTLKRKSFDGSSKRLISGELVRWEKLRSAACPTES